ncbi:MAG: DUF4373 domain-containing protein [Duncaniella sp.]|nr:DUF4373 domain-containing protein [Duncaniella sp.]
MARPRKTGLDYFPFDCDFFSDEKVFAVAGAYGIKGEITIVKLLCAIYRNGYFIEWSEMMRYKLLSQLPGVSEGLLDSIVSRLVKWGFFDKDLFDSAGVLTSRGIQQRYFEATKFRKLDGDLPYLLETPRVNYSKTMVSQTLTPVSQGKMPEIKLKENKLKKIYPPTSDTKKPAGAASEAEGGDVFGYDLPPDAERQIRMSLATVIANSEKMGREFGTDADTVMSLATEVADRWLMTGEFDRKHPTTHMMRTIGCKLQARAVGKGQKTTDSTRKRDVEAEIEKEREQLKAEERRHAAEVVKPDDYLKSKGLKPGTCLTELVRPKTEPPGDGGLPDDVREALDAIKGM